MDYRQHINHAAYLTYMENARLEYADLHFDQNLNFILASITVDYHSQLFHPANLNIGQKVVDVGNKSFKMLGAIFQGEKADSVVTTLTSLVCFDYKTQKTSDVSVVTTESAFSPWKIAPSILKLLFNTSTTFWPILRFAGWKSWL
jgi:YbgC/YbaW family acyl-CoA thioester hydrolase